MNQRETHAQDKRFGEGQFNNAVGGLGTRQLRAQEKRLNPIENHSSTQDCGA